MGEWIKSKEALLAALAVCAFLALGMPPQSVFLGILSAFVGRIFLTHLWAWVDRVNSKDVSPK